MPHSALAAFPVALAKRLDPLPVARIQVRGAQPVALPPVGVAVPVRANGRGRLQRRERPCPLRVPAQRHHDLAARRFRRGKQLVVVIPVVLSVLRFRPAQLAAPAADAHAEILLGAHVDVPIHELPLAEHRHVLHGAVIAGRGHTGHRREELPLLLPRQYQRVGPEPLRQRHVRKLEFRLRLVVEAHLEWMDRRLPDDVDDRGVAGRVGETFHSLGHLAGRARADLLHLEAEVHRAVVLALLERELQVHRLVEIKQLPGRVAAGEAVIRRRHLAVQFLHVRRQHEAFAQRRARCKHHCRCQYADVSHRSPFLSQSGIDGSQRPTTMATSI